MAGKSATPLLTSCFALALALVCGAVNGRQSVVASPSGDGLVDSDSDFLPDVVEWAVLTSSTSPDTDGDLVSDFVEVVQRGRPRDESACLPADQEMRVLVTGPVLGSGDPSAWLHIFVRVMGDPREAVASFQTWIELPALPGLRVPFDVLSLGPCSIAQRQTGSEGSWMSLSVPLVSTGVLQAIAPLSLHAESLVGGRLVHSSVSLFAIQGEVWTLVPFGGGFALQNISPQPVGGGVQSNRVCVLDLVEVGSGPGGTVFEVMAAECEDCNDVECSAQCPESVGWVLTVPGGLAGLGAPN